MPFSSRAQQAWMLQNKPEMAKEWASKMSPEDYQRLPQRVQRNPMQEAAKRRKGKLK